MVCQGFHNKTLSIHLTPYCNLACDFCYTQAENISLETTNGRGNAQQQSSGLLSLHQWVDILEEARTCGFSSLHIFGGEPFLYPNLSLFCKRATQLGYHILISTNGISFQPGDEDWLSSEKITLSFTINEIDKKWKQLPNFKRKWLVKLSQKGVPITISTCLTAKNNPHYSAFLADMQQHGYWGFFGIFFSPIGRATDKQELVVNPLLWVEFVDKLQELFPVKIERGYIPKDNVFFDSIDRKCQIPTEQMMTVNFQGDFFPCFLLVNEKAHKFAHWMKKGDFSLAYDEFQKIKVRYSTCSGCPAYINTDHIDFRLKIIEKIGERGKNLCIICPLVSF